MYTSFHRVCCVSEEMQNLTTRMANLEKLTRLMIQQNGKQGIVDSIHLYKTFFISSLTIQGQGRQICYFINLTSVTQGDEKNGTR